MIKANELRIGNYVKDSVSGEWMVVNELGENVGAVLLNRDKYPLPDGWKMAYIPITNKVLLRFGCTQGHDKEMWRNPIGVWLTRINGTNRFFIHGFRAGHYIEYLHQYQNACYAFTGEEIKLNL